MAIHVIVSVRDSAAQLYNRPFFVPNVNMARRDFQDEINRADDKNAMFKHPDDFELYQLGRYEEETGHFETLPQPLLVVRGKDLIDASRGLGDAAL